MLRCVFLVTLVTVGSAWLVVQDVCLSGMNTSPVGSQPNALFPHLTRKIMDKTVGKIKETQASRCCMLVLLLTQQNLHVFFTEIKQKDCSAPFCQPSSVSSNSSEYICVYSSSSTHKKARENAVKAVQRMSIDELSMILQSIDKSESLTAVQKVAKIHGTKPTKVGTTEKVAKKGQRSHKEKEIQSASTSTLDESSNGTLILVMIVLILVLIQIVVIVLAVKFVHKSKKETPQFVDPPARHRRGQTSREEMLNPGRLGEMSSGFFSDASQTLNANSPSDIENAHNPQVESETLATNAREIEPQTE